MKKQVWIRAAVVVAVLPAFGCNPLMRKAEFSAPSVSSSKAVSGVMTAYDSNGDGALDEAELRGFPAVVKSFAAYDADGDGRISADELAARLDTLFANGAVLTNVTCTVTHGRRPVPGAAVRFHPEDFLSDKLQPASGVTNAAGQATLAIADEELPTSMQGQSVIQVGVYRVEIESDGNTATFGHIVDPVDRNGLNPTFDLAAAGRR